MSLALVQANTASTTSRRALAQKWQVYRWLCEGKSIIGVGDRGLAVLSGLLSFYPDNKISEENGLMVFPSNAQLSLRAHGMADFTLRRNLADLVNCGLIIRRDSPNGKRFARKGKGRRGRGSFRVLVSAIADAGRRVSARGRTGPCR